MCPPECASPVVKGIMASTGMGIKGRESVNVSAPQLEYSWHKPLIHVYANCNGDHSIVRLGVWRAAAQRCSNCSSPLVGCTYAGVQ